MLCIINSLRGGGGGGGARSRLPQRSVSVRRTQRAEHDAFHRGTLRRRGGRPANIAHRAGGAEPGGPRGQDDADQGPRGPVGGHPGAHVQELGKRARVAVQPGGRPGRGPEGRPRPVRAGGEPAEQEAAARVEPRAARQQAPDAGERVQGPDRHSR